MASQWYIQQFDEEFGPVSFRELVQMVCQDTLTADDLVRSHVSDWQRADSVVGLFYMARRHAQEQEGAAAVELTESTHTAPDPECTDPVHPTAGEPLESSWIQRPKEEAAHQDLTTAHGTSNHGSDDELLESRRRSRLQQAIDDAVAAQVRRSSKRSLKGARLLRTTATSTQMVRGIFRWTLMLTAALLTALSINTWSQTESRRFPDPNIASEIHQFPFWGKCETSVFAILLIDAALMAGVAGYIAARTLESSIQD